MINFYSENDFMCDGINDIAEWINEIILLEGYEIGDIDFIFCDDDYLHKINLEFLKHDTLTDIISFNYGVGKQINGEVYISTERVAENATLFNTSMESELHRVIIHGILHYCGYNDKTAKEAEIMRAKEEESLARRNFM